MVAMLNFAQAAPLVVFNNGDVADADDVNANFSELEARINTISLTPDPVGSRGPAGADGADGADGSRGPAGADGADGADGSRGPAGADGAEPDLSGIHSAIEAHDDLLADKDAEILELQISVANLIELVAHRYQIGDIGPLGGTVFFIEEGTHGLHGMEVGDVGLSLSLDKLRWGGGECVAAGGFGTWIGSGRLNTATILNSCAGDSPAASYAAFYSGTPFQWFLPSPAELRLALSVTEASWVDRCVEDSLFDICDVHFWTSGVGERGLSEPISLRFDSRNLDFSDDAITEIEGEVVMRHIVVPVSSF